MKLSAIVPALVVVFLLAVSPVFAVFVTIPNFPSVITFDPFVITASISGAAPGTNYIRVDVYKEGTQNYFGETYNGNDWYGGSSGKEYFPVSIQSGQIWLGDVRARIGTINSSDYDGQGTYKMRLRRYTNSGGLGSEDPDKSAVSVTISVPTATPTPAPTSAPTHTPTPTPAPTQTPTPTPTRTPTPTKTPTPTVKPTPTLKPVASVSAVLGVAAVPATASVIAEKETKSSLKPLIISLLFVGIGCAILSLVFVWKKRNVFNTPKSQ